MPVLVAAAARHFPCYFAGTACLDPALRAVPITSKEVAKSMRMTRHTTHTIGDPFLESCTTTRTQTARQLRAVLREELGDYLDWLVVVGDEVPALVHAAVSEDRGPVDILLKDIEASEFTALVSHCPYCTTEALAMISLKEVKSRLRGGLGEVIEMLDPAEDFVLKGLLAAWVFREARDLPSVEEVAYVDEDIGLDELDYPADYGESWPGLERNMRVAVDHGVLDLRVSAHSASVVGSRCVFVC